MLANLRPTSDYPGCLLQNLVRDLKDKLSCNYSRVSVGLVTPTITYLVDTLRALVEGTCKVNDIVGILAWKDSTTLLEIKKIYKDK